MPDLPQADEVRAGLDRVLGSDAFAASTRLQRFLRFVVEQSLEGKGDELKEYSIGTSVFDRDEQYDPRIDSIVRVEAGRLRSKLDEYYNGPGAADDVVIRIPRGTYAPIVERRARDLPAAPGPAAPSNNSPSIRWQAAMALILAVFVAVAIAAATTDVGRVFRLRLSESSASSGETRRSAIGAKAVRPAPEAGSNQPPLSSNPRELPRSAVASAKAEDPAYVRTSVRPAIAVLPFTQYSADPAVQLLAARLTDGVTAQLSRFTTIGVVSHTSALQFEGARKPLKEIARALNADGVVEARIDVEGDTVRVQLRLVDGAVDRKSFIKEIEGSGAALPDLERRVAEAIEADVMRTLTPAPR